MHHSKIIRTYLLSHSINIGLPLLECPDTDKIEESDHIEVDFGSGLITNTTRNEIYQATPLPDFVRGIVMRAVLSGMRKHSRVTVADT